MEQVDEMKPNDLVTDLKSNKTSKTNGKKDDVFKMSIMASNTINVIRRMVDQLKLEPNPDKAMIPLSIGDPTTFGNLKCDEILIEAVTDALKSGKYNGYAPSIGYEETRTAVAKYSSCKNYNLTSKDIIITSGCSSALEYSILALANPGQNILIPRPAFPLYNTICKSSDINMKYYNLLSTKEWEVDLDHLEKEIDDNTVAILINNPSNPCGSVYTGDHITEILKVSEKHQLPIIADEIYGFCTFEGPVFEYMASYNDRVSILSCNGITKRFLCPGWRLGWIAIYDKCNRFKEIRQGLQDLSTRTVGANTLVQGAIPRILFNVGEEHFQSTIRVLKENCKIVESVISQTPGLRLVKPNGGMFALIEVQLDKFKSFEKNEDFVINMVKEESVFCLPSELFGIPNYIRITLTPPADLMRESCQRIQSYCIRHYCDSSLNSVSPP